MTQIKTAALTGIKAPAQTTLPPDYNAATDFLAMLAPDGDVTFQTFDDNEDRKAGDRVRVIHAVPKNYTTAMDALAALDRQGAGVFVTVNKTDGAGRTKENITAVRALFADFDTVDDDRPALLQELCTLPPSILVESSAGKHHAYWLVDDFPLDRFTEAQKAIIGFFKSDPAPKDLPRVMRLPGFTHHKVKDGVVSPPFTTRVIGGTGTRYTLAEITEWLASIQPAPTPRSNLAGVAVPMPRHGSDRHAYRALESAVGAVMCAKEPGRNNVLNREAHGLYGLVLASRLPMDQVTDRLTHAAKSCGLPDSRIAPTLASAYKAARPRYEGMPADTIVTLATTDPDAPPEPLLPSTPPAASYPIDALPSLMRGAALAIAHHVQAPIALAAQCVIGAAAYYAQSRVNAPHLFKPEGMPSALFMLTLADSGDRKSECRRLAFKVIDDAEKKARQAHKACVDEIEEGAAGLKGKSLEDYQKGNPLPADPRTQYSDASFERISGDFIAGLSAAAWDTDEGGQVLGGHSLKGDTRTAILGGLVKLFDNGTTERTRAVGNLQGSGFAYNRRLTVHLLAQDITVRDALNDPLLSGQGFLPRFLFASTESLAGSRFLTPERLANKPYSDPRLQAYWARCEEILATPSEIDPVTGEVIARPLQLTPEAGSEWMVTYNAWEAEQAALGEFEGLRPFAGRSGEIARRVAAVFACFNDSHEIDATCMRGALAVVGHSLSEWARYTGSVRIDPVLAQAIAVMKWLRDPKHAHHWQSFDKDRLGKSGPTAMRSAAKRDPVLTLLVNRRHLTSTDGKVFKLAPLAETADSAETQQPCGFTSAEDLRKSADFLRNDTKEADAPEKSAVLPHFSANLPQSESRVNTDFPQNPQNPHAPRAGNLEHLGLSDTTDWQTIL